MSLTYGFDLGTVGSKYSAEQFAEMSQRIFGDAVSGYGNQFALVLGNAFSVTLQSGMAYVDGYYIKSDSDISFTLASPYSSDTRYDAIAAVVDFTTRTGAIKLLTDIDPGSPAQSETEYQIYLYTFSITYGATQLLESDVSDVREFTFTLQDSSPSAMAAYVLTTLGLDTVTTRLQTQVSNSSDEALESIADYADIVESAINRSIGDIKESIETPGSYWFECDGSTISSSYSELVTLLGGTTLPELYSADSRLTVWIYAGAPS